MESIQIFVGCGKAKREAQTSLDKFPARDLYTSNYFQLKKRYAAQREADWYILSAKHGILDPSKEIKPYDTTLDTVEDRRFYADTVHDILSDWLHHYGPHKSGEMPKVDRVELLAGQNYIQAETSHGKTVAELFSTAFNEAKVVQPLKGCSGIGEQMAWLKRHASTQSTITDEVEA